MRHIRRNNKQILRSAGFKINIADTDSTLFFPENTFFHCLCVFEGNSGNGKNMWSHPFSACLKRKSDCSCSRIISPEGAG